MRILLAGASGFLGTPLAAHLRAAGHDVVRLVRREPAAADERRWDPAGGELDPAHLSTVDAVVNLAGANLGGRRWTPEYKRELHSSRIGTTSLLAKAIAGHTSAPALLNMSAVGYYGDTGDRAVDETTGAGPGFLPQLAADWEAATAPARDAGGRVVLMRTGLPLDPAGGMLQPMMLPFRFGVGGPLGDGRPFVAWISMPDWLAAVSWLLAHPEVSGPVNLVGPDPVRHKELAKALGRQLHRPALIPVPKLALKAAVGGEFATEILKSQRVLPAVLTGHGFEFAHRTVDAALAAALD